MILSESRSTFLLASFSYRTLKDDKTAETKPYQSGKQQACCDAT